MIPEEGIRTNGKENCWWEVETWKIETMLTKYDRCSRSWIRDFISGCWKERDSNWSSDPLPPTPAKESTTPTMFRLPRLIGFLNFLKQTNWQLTSSKKFKTQCCSSAWSFSTLKRSKQRSKCFKRMQTLKFGMWRDGFVSRLFRLKAISNHRRMESFHSPVNPQHKPYPQTVWNHKWSSEDQKPQLRLQQTTRHWREE